MAVRIERFPQPGLRVLRLQFLGGVAGDDLEILAERVAIARVALRVVPVEMRIHQVPHRLRRNLLLDLRDQGRRRRRLRMGIHHQHIGRVYKDGGIAIDHRLRPRESEVDSLGHLLNLKQIGRGAGAMACAHAARRPARSRIELPAIEPKAVRWKKSRRETACRHIRKSSSRIRIQHKPRFRN